LANPVLLRQEILGKVREAIGTVEFEIPYIFVLKKDNSKNVYKEAKKHAEQIIIDLYNNMSPYTILIIDGLRSRHCKVFTDEDGEEATEYRYAIAVKMSVTDDMIKECYKRIK